MDAIAMPAANRPTFGVSEKKWNAENASQVIKYRNIGPVKPHRLTKAFSGKNEFAIRLPSTIQNIEIQTATLLLKPICVCCAVKPSNHFRMLEPNSIKLDDWLFFSNDWMQ